MTKVAELTQEALDKLEADNEGLRTQISKVNAESAERRVKLKSLEEEKVEKDKAALSETEKLQAKVAAIESEQAATKAENEVTKKQLEAERIRTAVLEKARELGFANTEDAFALIDLSKVEVIDDKISGFEKLLEDLAESGRLVMGGGQGDSPGTLTVKQVKKSSEKLQPGDLTEDGRRVAKVSW